MRLIALLLLMPSPTFADAGKSAKGIPKTAGDEDAISLFDGTSTFGWTVTGEAKVENGILTLGGEKPSKITWNHGTVPGRLDIEEQKGNIGLGEVRVMKKSNEPLEIATTAGTKRQITNIRLKPAEGKQLFNGKDLTGWKENMTKKASVFSVTKEGWLNVKNGPGDLQTESQYADFLLQIECISNGKHLNSGIFFRCLPGLYQQGYEAQIRNEWMGDDRTKPVDFGTGAIYRRVPARKVVSTDGEWFTMTVLAKGKRLSTWVNGYPVVDWLDERKEADNGRNGAKTSKGAISIQGHDPTTDLSFRNLRILSLD